MSYEAHYANALSVGTGTSSGDLGPALLAELRSFLGLSLGDPELLAACRRAGTDIFAEWKRLKIDPKDKEAVTRFYVDTDLYCYDLLALEIDAPKYRQDQLREIVGFLKKNGKLRGCDYGSGIGTLGIYLNRNGVICDFADVSQKNLDFIGKRLEARGLSAPMRVNLLKQSLPRGEYDFVTAFDVLEHVTDPVSVMGEIASMLRPGGYFIFNVLCEDEEGTPHILRDPNVIRKPIRGFGLTKIGQFGEFKVYEKVSRPAWANALIREFDTVFWEARERLRSLKHKR